MKRVFLLLFIIVCGLSLTGCAGIYANTREVEQLLVIQTMGLDTEGVGVQLSLASGAGVRAAGSPARLHGSAQTITAAIERIRNLANEDDLFCAHISHVLLGEATARNGVDFCLSYICRSPDLRISVPLYVLRGARAEEAVLGVGDDSYGVCDALDSVDSDVRLRGDGSLFTAAQIAQSLSRTGSALICAVDYAPSAEEKKIPVSGGDDASSQEETAAEDGGGEAPIMTVAAAGYGVLKDGRLCAWLSREQAVGVGLLLNDTGPCEVIVRDRSGNPVTLELNRGRSAVRPRWGESGALEGLEILVEATAALEEYDGSGQDAAWDSELTARFEAALSERIGSVLQLSKRLGADFLDLGGQVERADPLRFRALERPFGELLPQLSIRLSVSGTLEHTNDVKDGGL